MILFLQKCNKNVDVCNINKENVSLFKQWSTCVRKWLKQRSKSDILKSIENQTSWTWIILPVKIRYTQSVIIKIHVCETILARGQKIKGKATANILICTLINMFMRSNIMYNLFWCIVPVMYEVELILIQYFLRARGHNFT